MSRARSVQQVQTSSLHLEDNYLSCLMQRPSLIREHSSGPEIFTRERNRFLYLLLCEMEEEGGPIDEVSVAHEVAKQDKSSLAGNPEQISDLFWTATTTANAAFYLQKLEELRLARSLEMRAKDIIQRISRGEAPEDILGVLERSVEALTHDSSFQSSHEIVSPSHLLADVETLYREDIPTGVGTGWFALDRHFKPRPGELTLGTGIPGHGKTSFLDALLVNLARIHGWRSLLFSAENLPFENHIAGLLEIKTGKPFRKGFHERMTDSELREGLTFVNEHFTFLNPEKPTLDRVLELAERAIQEKEYKVLVIDPWNELEHKWGENQAETHYISDCLTKIRRFGRRHKIHVFVIAHPMKPKKEADGSYPPPSPYDISGGAHWRNKADNCFTVYRNINGDGYEDPNTEIHITKVRFREVGKIGVVKLAFDRVTGRYSSIDHNSPGEG